MLRCPLRGCSWKESGRCPALIANRCSRYPKNLTGLLKSETVSPLQTVSAQVTPAGHFYSAAAPLDNCRSRFENVALAATGEVGLIGNELRPRCSASLRQ